MNFVLRVWRQARPDGPGAFERFEVSDVSGDMSFLEMLDVLNERLISSGAQPVAFESDCREGICGACGFMINGARMGHCRARRCASFTCAPFTTAKSCGSSPGAGTRSPWSAT